MSEPKKIVVVDDEPTLCRLIEAALMLPEFEVHSFGDPRDALPRLHGIAPDLIVCDVLMPVTDGPTFFRTVKKSRELRNVPFIFLSAVDSSDDIVALLEEGADDFVSKPFEIRRLVAKIRATLRMSERLGALERRKDSLSGELGIAGALPLMKFCEDSRLTGRLLVDSPGHTCWVEFHGGELVQAGQEPRSDDDPLGALLAAKAGHYTIEQKSLDADALKKAERSVGGTDPTPVPAASDEPITPGGRLSGFELRGETIQVQTEGDNRPNFTVTTVVSRGGRILRKIETGWDHPLKRASDAQDARAHIDRQHERVVATLRTLTEAAPEPGAEGVDASLLAWALSFVAEQVRDHLGSVMTVVLLRQVHARLCGGQPGLKAFRVLDDGRVTVASEDGRASARAPVSVVREVAAWLAAFLDEAGSVGGKPRGLPLRQVTKMMESDLEAVDFYGAVALAQADLEAEGAAS